MEFKNYKLGDIGKFKNGVNFPATQMGSGIPLVNVKDITNDGFLYPENLDRVEIKINEDYYAEVGDIFFVRSSVKWEGIGDVNIFKSLSIPSTHCGFIIRFRIDKKIADPIFLYYLFKNPSFRNYIRGFSSGTAIYNISQGGLKFLKLSVPLLPFQIKIAKVLSAYDDLIENNLRRIRLLEELAINCFNDLVNNNKGKIIDWSEITLRSMVKHEIGGGWGEENKNNEFSEAAYVIRGTDIDEIPKGKFGQIPFRYHKKSNLASRKMQDGDIVFEVSGGSHYEGVAKTLLITNELLTQFDNDVMCASFCKLLRPVSRDLSNFIFLFLRFLRAIGGTEVFEIRSASNIVNYNWTAFLKFQKVKVPDDKSLKQYNEIIDPIYKQIYTLGHQNRLLKEARDILLPRLMTGMIEL